MTLSERFVQLLADIDFARLGGESIQAAKSRCIDYLGATAGGVEQGELASHLLLELSRTAGKKGGECVVIGTPYKASVTEAAFVNGVTGHALELDDGHRRGYGHPAVVVFSALFPLAEKLHSSGKDFLAATAVGYETFVRLGQVCNPGTLRRGFHTSGVVGTLAVAMAAAKLMRFDKRRMLNALGVAGLSASGLCITFHSGGSLKAFNTGRASQNGLSAVKLASIGAEGAPDILEGKDGFFHAYSGQEINERILLADVKAPLAVETSYVKFYPSCRYTHAPIDAALALRDKVKLEDIREIIVTTYPTAIYLAAKKDLPSDLATARFNIGFAVALALVKGQPSISDFHPDSAKDKMLQQLFTKIRFVEDPAYDSAENNIRGAAMDIVTANDKVSVRVPLPVGEPENPAPEKLYTTKFNDMAAAVWKPQRRKSILKAVGRMEELDDIRSLTRLLAAS
ncbi:MAG: MmgE/PrpD family protein [Desulfovibrio sp.]|nr:MmgE/PrpD family protein [Desulfovibrio sp.]